MAHKSATKRSQNGKRTIILPITQEQYDKIIVDPKGISRGSVRRFPGAGFACQSADVWNTSPAQSRFLTSSGFLDKL